MFLDFDGVLNSSEFFTDKQPSLDRFLEFDPEAVRILAAIVRITQADVVVSSGWSGKYSDGELSRMLEECTQDPIWHTCLVGQIENQTPTRQDAIARWIHNSDPLESYVILEDVEDMTIHGHRAIEVDPSVGLTSQDAYQAVCKLMQWAEE